MRYASELRRLSVLLPDREQLFRLVEGDRPAFVAPPAEEPAEADAFDLIDHYLDGVRTSGEDLPEVLHYEGGGEGGDYFAGEANEPLSPDGLSDLLDASPAQSAPAVAPSSEEPAPEELLSETLSKIYIQQQHYDKALRIIRSLSLNYPEKNRFFADQIRFLERLIANNNTTN